MKPLVPDCLISVLSSVQSCNVQSQLLTAIVSNCRIKNVQVISKSNIHCPQTHSDFARSHMITDDLSCPNSNKWISIAGVPLRRGVPQYRCNASLDTTSLHVYLNAALGLVAQHVTFLRSETSICGKISLNQGGSSSPSLPHVWHRSSLWRLTLSTYVHGIVPELRCKVLE